MENLHGNSKANERAECDNLQQIVFRMNQIKEHANSIQSILKTASSLGPTAIRESLDANNYESFVLESRLKNLLGNIQKQLNDSTKWQCFLQFLYELLSQWDVHRNQDDFDLSALKEQIKVWQISDKDMLGTSLKPYLQKIHPSSNTELGLIANFTLDAVKLGNLKDILDIATDNRQPISVCEDNTLRVMGYYVALSDVKCPDHVENVEIMALHRFYVDEDWKSSGKLKVIVIIAPTWEIVSDSFADRTINLDGAAGEEHKERKAKAGRSSGKPGQDGKRGLRGCPAGSFLGFAQTLINSEKLTISANGGAGGIGQHGGDGYSGNESEIFEAAYSFSFPY